MAHTLERSSNYTNHTQDMSFYNPQATWETLQTTKNKNSKIQSRLTSSNLQLVKNFLDKRSSKASTSLLDTKKTFHPIKETCELEEDDCSIKQKSTIRAKSSSQVRRGKCRILNPRFRPNSSNFMYRPLRSGVTKLTNQDLLDVKNSDIIFAQSSVGRPSTTTFTNYQQRYIKDTPSKCYKDTASIISGSSQPSHSRILGKAFNLKENIHFPKNSVKYEGFATLKARPKLFKNSGLIKNLKDLKLNPTLRSQSKSGRRHKQISDMKEKSLRLKMKIINAESIGELQEAQSRLNRLDQNTTKTKRFRDVIHKYINFSV